MKLIKNTQDIANFLGIDIKFNNHIKDFQIDSRQVTKNSLFFGLQGSKEDGSKYADHALKQGAALALIKKTNSSKENDTQSKIQSVKNPAQALIILAQNVLDKYNGSIIGITGSNGKTTTKNILHSGINNSFATFENYNNEIGLPLCALSLNTKQKIAVFEMGAAKKGDIDFLSNIVNQT